MYVDKFNPYITAKFSISSLILGVNFIVTLSVNKSFSFIPCKYKLNFLNRQIY